MLYKFLNAQWNNPVKNDWTNQVRQDLKDLDITEDFGTLRKYKKKEFKKFINEKMKKYCLNYLNNLKESHSKMKSITIGSVKVIQPTNKLVLRAHRRRSDFLVLTRVYKTQEFSTSFSVLLLQVKSEVTTTRTRMTSNN